jgi:hypothetical protein
MKSPAPGVVAMRRLEAEFPGWRLWISDTGRWWAFRTSACALTIEQLRAGCRLIVQADTSEALHSAIRAEIEAERRTDTARRVS